MKLDFTNIGGIRLVPHGESSPVTYGWGTLDKRVSAGQYSGRLRFRHPSQPIEGTTTGVLVPGVWESKPILDITGKVYIPNIPILDDTTTDHYSYGGYLGTKTFKFTFRDGNGAIDIVSFDSLAVIPATYTGGLVVEGIDLPGQVITWNRGGYPWARGNYEVVSIANGFNVFAFNANCPESFNWTWIWNLKGFIGDDVRFDGIERLEEEEE